MPKKVKISSLPSALTESSAKKIETFEKEKNLSRDDMTNEFSAGYSIGLYTTGCYYFSEEASAWSSDGTFFSFEYDLLSLQPPDNVRKRFLSGAEQHRFQLRVCERCLRRQPHHLLDSDPQYVFVHNTSRVV
ncbi:hypothetical protein CEXT_626581 [Caerostris extrusa]|uniref:USP domain-containing protein n=1 Tax=Caerostris extrusa TaxID=172846 RepID=A0AAV4Q8U2_CAEEX|nr:hypothetical protein CEXT_626581 [Caerostris extrusa]